MEVMTKENLIELLGEMALTKRAYDTAVDGLCEAFDTPSYHFSDSPIFISLTPKTLAGVAEVLGVEIKVGDWIVLDEKTKYRYHEIFLPIDGEDGVVVNPYFCEYHTEATEEAQEQEENADETV